MHHSIYAHLTLLAVFTISVSTACNYSEKISLGINSTGGSGTTELSSSYPLIGPVSREGYQAILATTDLGLGENRLAFILLSNEGFVTSEVATLRIYQSETLMPEHTYEAPLLNWIVSKRGTYVSNVEFPEGGEWKAIIHFEHDGSEQYVELSFLVRGKTAAPSVGDLAPDASSKTLNDVTNMQDLSTGVIREPELYRHSLAEAVRSGWPTIVSFTSPAFCENEVCGPQVDVLIELYKELSQQAYFIHVDVYNNPSELQGDLDLAYFSQAFRKWGLPSLQWTFVIDCEGKIAEKFQGFVTSEELRPSIISVIQNVEAGKRCRSA